MKSRTFVKPVFTTQMRCAVVCVFVSLALASQAFAVLRPLFPAKPTAPTNGDLIIIEDELLLRSTKSPLPDHRDQARAEEPRELSRGTN